MIPVLQSTLTKICIQLTVHSLSTATYKGRNADNQTNKQTNKEIQKQTNQTNIRSKQTIKHKQKQANKTNKQTNKSKQTDKPTHDQARCRRTTRANAQDLL
jgi:hypothetical protein